MKTWLLPVLLAAALLSVQGDRKKKPPELPPLDTGKKAAPPQAPRKGRSASLPFVNPAPGDDLIQRFRQNNPFLGVWRVTRIVRPRAPTSHGRGYMIFTRTFLSMHLWVAGNTAGAQPRFQSSMRTYRVEGPALVSTSLMGVRSGARDGRLVLEGNGYTEKRRFTFYGANVLRIVQAPNAYIEMTKVEDL